MTNHFATRVFHAPKVPSIGVGFWGVKLLTTAMGEAASDFFVHHYSPPLVVVIAGLIFLVSLTWQFTRREYQTLPYWFSVMMVSVFGTMCADVAHVAFGIAYSASESGHEHAVGIEDCARESRGFRPRARPLIDEYDRNCSTRLDTDFTVVIFIL